MRYVVSKGLTFLFAVAMTGLLIALVTRSANADAIRDGVAVEPSIETEAQSKPVKTATKKNAPGKSYFVEFRARSAATYGHMYVLYGQVNSRGEIIKSDIVGLHPAGDANNCENCSVMPWTLGHLFFVPSETGASDGDLEEKYVADRYRVMVDGPTYNRVAQYIAKLRADNPQWHALWRNCVSFGRDIAEFMGLQAPGFIWTEPKQFVEGLRLLNGGEPQGPLKDAAGLSRATTEVSPPKREKNKATKNLTSGPGLEASSENVR